ncbi:predicted protein [Nematostella vectensis]|uniref:Uncharacterized protein n=1 Tax=Nematostella vectensis TaxID=45351 RepID=A7S7A2_NEMVE|nr:uncharacterized protein LOC5512075 [Nematostella vectensis]EDO40356.1 predicted protein [Nematostella vectensis]|eukprot:XP_001632419.1 predicted protein [Nematostella vectensis]
MKKLEIMQNKGLVPRGSDTGKDIALRNSGENRRLKGQLQEYDSQLYRNVVSLQAEIMELKASPYGKSKAARLRSAQQQALLRQDRERRGLIKQDALEVSSTIDSLGLSPRMPRRNKPKSKQIKSSSSGELILPEINPSYTGLVAKGAGETRRSLVPTRELLAPELRQHRHKSLPDITDLSPRMRRRMDEKKLIDSFQKKEESALPTGRNAKQLLNNRVKEFINSPQTSLDKIIITPPCNEETKETEELSTKPEQGEGLSEDELALFHNSLLLKTNSYLSLSSSMPDLAKIGFMDFNEVIDKRLKMCQEEPPSEEEMRKIRYLRLRDEPKEADILSVFEKESSSQ